MAALSCGKYGWIDRGPKAVRFDGNALFDSHGCRVETLLDRFPVLRPFYSTFENSFDANDAMNWAREHWILPLVICAGYLVYIFVTAAVMKNREPFKLRGLLQLWNLLLAVFSAIGFVRTAPHLINNFYGKGFQSTVCAPAEKEYCMGAAGFWTMLFIFSKIPELIDTVFIVLRKNKLIFLHWYHHVTVLLFCWHSYATRSSMGLYFIAMNYGVHALMYFYYFLSASGIKVGWASLVTTLQILQMFGGMAICASGALFKYYQRKPCDTTDDNLLFGSALYASYAVLFIYFAMEKYCRGGSKKELPAKTTGAAAVTAGKSKKSDEPAAAAADRDPSPAPSSEDDPKVSSSNSGGGARRRKQA